MAEPKKRVVPAGTTQLVAGIESRIFSIRGLRVLLSPDLAELYGVETKVLTQAVRCNLDHFPADFAFPLQIKSLCTFVKLRGMLAEHADLKHLLDQLKKKYDSTFKMVFDAIHQLMAEPVPGGYSRRRIGFTKDK